MTSRNLTDELREEPAAGPLIRPADEPRALARAVSRPDESCRTAPRDLNDRAQTGVVHPMNRASWTFEAPRGLKPAARVWRRIAPGDLAKPLIGLLALLAPSAALRGDQIVARGVNYPGAKIAALENGQLLFRTIEGKPEAIWLSDVDQLIVDQGDTSTDFNQAERYLDSGEPDKAIIRYRRSLRHSAGFWPDLIAARLVVACDRAARLDQAALHYIRVVRGEFTGPALAVRLIPQTIPAERTAKAVHAIEHLEAAITDHLPPEQRVPLEWLRYEIMRRSGDKRRQAAARIVATLVVPKIQRCEHVYAILLPALEHVLRDGADADELASLNRAIRDCPDSALPAFLLLKGNTLLHTASTREDFIRASWPFLRVAIHLPDHPKAAEGLYGAALAVDRIGRKDKAIELLTECLQHEHLGDETRQVAEAALARLRPSGGTSP